MEQRYSTKDIADMLGVETVTVRKYALALEKAGYSIERSDGKNRSFSDVDAMAFKHLQALRAQTGITVEFAADVVAKKKLTATVEESNIVHSVDGEHMLRYEERYDALQAKVDVQGAQIVQLVELNKALIERLDQREEREAKRDAQVIEMLTALREQKEAVQQLAAAQELKRTLWQRIQQLFGK